jgi:hypothetical protein
VIREEKRREEKRREEKRREEKRREEKRKTLRGLNAGRALANFGNHGVAESCIAAGNV